ncbi:hypothetical protein N7474_011153 [Penicillium riverlandense]|uniref:uncharacterized protein n=1 Tax=Penicillium riverlandense TaxID=1903569 RepID=UPI0025471300|nr:uncharacterized protein N7474_011153 [Penicillium riverlandense]KAJ5805266.1 hypothetical protein N7474_011153 [Penicillium riverlandense]
MEATILPSRDRHVNARVLKPILRAYALGYLSSVTPKLISYVRRLGSHKGWTTEQKLQELARVLTNPIRVNGFPTFCASLIGGSTVLPVLLYRLYASIAVGLGSKGDLRISHRRDRLVRFAAAFLSSWFSFQLLNRNRVCLRAEDVRAKRVATADADQVASDVREHQRPELAGRTMDLTLFTVTRAIDVVACIAWNRWSRRRKAQNRWTVVESLAPGLADAGVFAASAAVVMWAWFYLPERLPRTYEKWIGEAAQVDSRLIEALRRVRRGVFVYGKETGQAPLLQSMCKDYRWPAEWGIPSRQFRFHAKWSIWAVAPALVLRLRGLKSAASLRRALLDSAQSSAFLASFVSLFYYGVCLARTRIGPKVFDQKTVTPLMWDSGLCVASGCFMCGWSVLVEKARRRQELAQFVAPRAAATILPRLYDKKYQYRERVAFAVSAAILLTCLRERPSMVRGVFGRITTSVLN